MTNSTEDRGEAVNQVWTLEAGDTYERSGISGIYADRELARDDFLTKVAELLDRWSTSEPDRLELREDGGIYVELRSDFVELLPAPVVTQAAARTPAVAALAALVQGQLAIEPAKADPEVWSMA